MRRVLVCSLLALALAGCGGGSTTSSGPTSGTPSTAASTPGDASSTPSTGPSGGAGCEALTKDDLAAFIVGSQLLAQVRDKQTLDSMISSGVGGYSPESFGAILAKMSFLTGDAGDGVAKLTQANDAVKALAAGSGAQADFYAYQKQSGGIAGVL
jgi:hypothetical protein